MTTKTCNIIGHIILRTPIQNWQIIQQHTRQHIGKRPVESATEIRQNKLAKIRQHKSATNSADTSSKQIGEKRQIIRQQIRRSFQQTIRRPLRQSRVISELHGVPLALGAQNGSRLKQHTVRLSRPRFWDPFGGIFC